MECECCASWLFLPYSFLLSLSCRVFMLHVSHFPQFLHRRLPSLVFSSFPFIPHSCLYSSPSPSPSFFFHPVMSFVFPLFLVLHVVSLSLSFHSFNTFPCLFVPFVFFRHSALRFVSPVLFFFLRATSLLPSFQSFVTLSLFSFPPQSWYCASFVISLSFLLSVLPHLHFTKSLSFFIFPYLILIVPTFLLTLFFTLHSTAFFCLPSCFPL